MFGVIFKLFGAAFLALFIIYGAVSTWHRSRLLDRKIREFKAEQEALRKSGQASDPYSELAKLYTEKDRPGRRRR